MARKLRADEREAVNRQLPASKKRNLGGKSLMVSREDLARTPLGAPPVDYDVRSTYAVRPIAAFDFNICAQQTFDSIGTPRLIQMTVPGGFIAVLKRLDIWFEPNPVGALRSAYNWSLALNGANVNYNENIFFGVGVDGEEVFYLADEFNRLGVRFGASSAANLVDIVGFVRFYGTFQLKTEVPLPFEIANPTSRGRGIRPGQLPVRELPREPTAQTAAVTPAAKPPAQIIREVIREIAPAIVAPKKQMLLPPFAVSIMNDGYTAVKPKGGGFVPLTQQELITYAEFVETKRRR